MYRRSPYTLDNHNPDFIIFTLTATEKECDIIELKDGDDFDTKKSAAELETLEGCMRDLAPQIPFKTTYHICCFNQNDEQKIVDGFKHRFRLESVMTGRTFCKKLNLDYDGIINQRRRDSQDNIQFFAEQVADIPEVMDALAKLQQPE